MKRRNFIKSAITLLAAPFISINKTDAKPISQPIDRLKLSHQYSGAYHDPNDLWTPEEITEAGFIFVEFPTFIHRFDDPYHPIMKLYVNPNEVNHLNLKPMVVKTSRYCGVGYPITCDDLGRWRGLERNGKRQ